MLYPEIHFKYCIHLSIWHEQGAAPEILLNTPSDFFQKIVSKLRECADICYERSKEIPCITSPSKPEGSMFAMVKTKSSAQLVSLAKNLLYSPSMGLCISDKA